MSGTYKTRKKLQRQKKRKVKIFKDNYYIRVRVSKKGFDTGQILIVSEWSKDDTVKTTDRKVKIRKNPKSRDTNVTSRQERPTEEIGNLGKHVISVDEI